MPDKNENRNMTTLGIIAKDEEAYMGQCLRYHKPFFDRIVVLDGGSTDNTVDVAESHEAEVYLQNEVGILDDFAAMRNSIADECLTEWVLMVDADELFDYDFLTNMAQYIAPDSTLRREHVVAFRFPRLNLDNGNPIDYHVRLYRPYACEWRGQVHEKLYLKGTDLRVDQAKIDGFEVCQTLEGHNIIHLQRHKSDRVEQRRRWQELADDT